MGFLSKIVTRWLSGGVQGGRLNIRFPNGEIGEFGDGPSPPIEIAITSETWLRKILLDPELQFGDAYMEGGVRLESGDLYDLVDLLWQSFRDENGNAEQRLAMVFRRLFRALAQFNPQGRSLRNVTHHYDIGNDLYQLFLDEDMQYSCAYFPNSETTLEEAQRLKKDHIARKLCLKPGQKILDIGCGWGGMALHLANTEHVDVYGITLSSEQINLAKCRAEAERLSGRVSFAIQDYRNLTETYDRIVSVGMFEHVGVPHYQAYFDRVAACLKEDGVALIHTIGRAPGPGVTNPWIAKRIFPGGYIPALSEIVPMIERAGLMVLDVEVLRLHYAETLRAWRTRFLDNADKAEALYDDRFVRMWDFYLASSEVSFRSGLHNVFQVQIGKQQDAAPLTRDYLYPVPKAQSVADFKAFADERSVKLVDQASRQARSRR